MVKEHRFVFDPSDISSFVYVCSKCHQEVHVPLQGDHRMSRQCGSCGEDLFDSQPSGHFDPNDELLSSLRSVLNLSNTRVKVRFVVPDPDAK